MSTTTTTANNSAFNSQSNSAYNSKFTSANNSRRNSTSNAGEQLKSFDKPDINTIKKDNEKTITTTPSAHVYISPKTLNEVTIMNRYTGFKSSADSHLFANTLIQRYAGVEQCHRGFISNSIHFSLDNSEILCYNQWETIEDYHLYQYDPQSQMAAIECNKLLIKLGGINAGEQSYHVEKQILGHSKLLYEEPHSPTKAELNELNSYNSKLAIDPITHLPRKNSLGLGAEVSEWPRDWPTY